MNLRAAAAGRSSTGEEELAAALPLQSELIDLVGNNANQTAGNDGDGDSANEAAAGATDKG